MRTEDRTPSSESQREQQRLPARPSVGDYALLEELRFVRREAQVEADLAYEDWIALPSGERYAVYRAAQDRADAAQDQLAHWARELDRDHGGARLTLQA